MALQEKQQKPQEPDDKARNTAAGQERGVYNGRKPKIDPVEVRRLASDEKLSPSDIAKRLNITCSSVYCFLPGFE